MRRTGPDESGSAQLRRCPSAENPYFVLSLGTKSSMHCSQLIILKKWTGKGKTENSLVCPALSAARPRAKIAPTLLESTVIYERSYRENTTRFMCFVIYIYIYIYIKINPRRHLAEQEQKPLSKPPSFATTTPSEIPQACKATRKLFFKK